MLKMLETQKIHIFSYEKTEYNKRLLLVSLKVNGR